MMTRHLCVHLFCGVLTLTLLSTGCGSQDGSGGDGGSDTGPSVNDDTTGNIGGDSGDEVDATDDTAAADTAAADAAADDTSNADTAAPDDTSNADTAAADDTSNGACKSSADCPQPPTGCVGNVCLAGVCSPQTFADGSPCNDGNACTAQATCQAGSCNAIELVLCDDGKPCTVDSCDPATGACKHGAATAGSSCDDGNSCTLGTTCDEAGTCVGGSNSCGCASIQDCAAYDDGDACNGTLYCNLNLPIPACEVLPASVVICDSSLDGACQKTGCDPYTGQCLSLPVADGQACDDGNSCTKGDACLSGSCKSPVNTCQCQVSADCLGYDDGNACNGTLYCDVSALPYTCKVNPASVKVCPKPASQCEVAACDAKTGACSANPAPDGSPCEDGNAKTVGDACTKGICTPGASVAQCGSDADCAKWEDGDYCNGIKFCNKAKGICEDNPATVVQCPTVDDTACSKTQCQPKTGLCLPVATPNNAPCSDGDSCTAGDSCQDGQCQASANVCDCQQDSDCAAKEDGDLCNGTLFCDKVKGSCVLNPKTVVVCATANDTACSVTSCVAKTGSCVAKAQADGKPCDDGSSCTSDDACVSGSCTGTKTCACTQDTDCAGNEDGNLCNGTLYCNKKSNSCEVNPATIKTCPTAGDTACTKTLCEPATGQCAKVASSNGVSCDADGNPCTQNDFCSGGQCKPGASVCECYTDDDCKATAATTPGGDNKCILGMLCDPDSHACKPAKQVQCDTSADGPCTKTACDPADGQCKPKLQPESTVCGESAVCAGAQVCDAKGACVPGPKSDCDDADACTGDSCDASKGCVFTALDSGSCDDGNVCTSGDSCSKGQCSGTAKDCTDETPCTDDACDPKLGCVHLPSAATSCNDGDVCSVGDFCFQGLCLSGSKVLPCDDGNPCTADSCDKVQGCVTKAQDGGKCDDDDGCTKFDTCQGGSCKGVQLSCDDGSGCTVDSCDKVEGCLHSPQTGKACDDGNACTAGDACISSGLCASGAPKVCDDANPCTVDLCDPLQGCVTKQVVGSKCDDGNACTVNEKCDKGQCTGSPRDCDDGLVCSKDSCDKDAGCLYAITAGSKCDDGNACTAGDTCAKGGACVPGPGLSCDDNNGCTTDACDPASGCTHKALDGIGCNDGDSCTQADKCTKGTCKGTGTSCDDGLVCTTDGCDPAGGCTHKVQAGATCSDNDACTNGDSCLQSGYCKPGTSVSCDDGKPCTADACLPQKGCENTVKTGSACNDDNACTAQDICSAQAVCAGKVISCDDGKACTTDSCDKLSGCKNVAQTNSPCDDGNACSTGDTCLASGACVASGAKVCNDNNGCTADSCDPKTGCVNAVQDKASCDDGSACTAGDACAGSSCVGSPVNCDDGQTCTKDTCDKAKGCVATAQANTSCSDGNACTVGDTCSNAGTCAPGTGVNCDDGKPCTTDSCDKGSGCKNTALDGIACSDGDACTQQDVCAAGACKGSALSCDDGNACTTDTCDSKLGCKTTAKTGTSCNDNNPCTSSDACDSVGKCVGSKVICDDGSVCTFDLCSTDVGCVYTKMSGASCNDNKLCTVNDVCSDGACGGTPKICDDDNVCTADSCDAAKGCVFAPIANKTCDDGDACTVGDACVGGSCKPLGPMNCSDGNDCTVETCHKLLGCQSALAKPDAKCSDGDPCTLDWCDGLGSCATVPQLGSRSLPLAFETRAMYVAADATVWAVGASDSQANGGFVARIPWRGKQPPIVYTAKLREYYAITPLATDESGVASLLVVGRNQSASGDRREAAGTATLRELSIGKGGMSTWGEAWNSSEKSSTALNDPDYTVASNSTYVGFAGTQMGLSAGNNGVTLTLAQTDGTFVRRGVWHPASLTGRDHVETRGLAVGTNGLLTALVVTSDANKVIVSLVSLNSKQQVSAKEIWTAGTNADMAYKYAPRVHMVTRDDGSFDVALMRFTNPTETYTVQRYSASGTLFASSNAQGIDAGLRFLHRRGDKLVGITEDLRFMPLGRSVTNPASIFSLLTLPEVVAYGPSREAYFVKRSKVNGFNQDTIERRDPWASQTCSDCMTKHALGCNDNECNVDECTSSDGKCSGSTNPAYCSDGNPCTTETCSGGKCSHTAVSASSNTSCALSASACMVGNGVCGDGGVCAGQQSPKVCFPTPNACLNQRCIDALGCATSSQSAGTICGSDSQGATLYCPNGSGGACAPPAGKIQTYGQSKLTAESKYTSDLPKFGVGLNGKLRWLRYSVTVEITAAPFVASTLWGGIYLVMPGGDSRLVESSANCGDDKIGRSCFATGAVSDTFASPEGLSQVPGLMQTLWGTTWPGDGMLLRISIPAFFKVTDWSVELLVTP